MGKPTRRASGFSRRHFLQGAGGAGALLSAPWLGGCNSGGSGREPGSAPTFAHGVASGDPLADRVILWTRVTPASPGPVTVQWELAHDPGMTDVVAGGEVRTGPERDYTVKLDPAGLTPDTAYYYRFRAGGGRSRTGRTRTLPVGDIDRLRLAVVSCASYPHGFFNAYARIAERADLHAVLHLGDYLYEYGNAPGQYGADVQAGGRRYEPEAEILTLSDYRTRHAWYKRDGDLQALHAQHPVIAVWDDHETTNNSYRDGAENHTAASEGPWELRKAWALQAYYEWMPIRADDPGNLALAYRGFDFGSLATVSMLETRLLARVQPASSPAAADEINDPTRRLLGDTQFQWLANRVAGTAGRWHLLGQQVMFGQLRLVGLPELRQRLPLADVNDLLARLPLAGTGGVLLNTDQWDGYRAARDRVFELMSDSTNTVVLTGDIHTSWAMDLTPDPSDPLVYDPLTGNGSLGVEFVAPSVTSPGLDELAPVQDLIRLNNPHIRYVDLSEHGYVLLDIDAGRIQAEWWYVDDTLSPNAGERFAAAYVSDDGSNRLRPGPAAPSQPIAGAPLPAPGPDRR